MKRLFALFTVLLAITAHAEEILYPASLDAATVVEDRLDDIGKRAIVLGNGDLNALL